MKWIRFLRFPAVQGVLVRKPLLSAAVPMIGNSLKVHRQQWLWLLLSLLLVIVVVVCPDWAWAEDQIKVPDGTGKNDFNAIYKRLVGWIRGDLGKTLSTAFVLIGLAYGMARSSLIGFAVGAGAAVGLQVTPFIVESIFTVIAGN